MQMKQNGDRVEACTTSHFEGIIAVINPEKSWVAKWQRTGEMPLLSFMRRCAHEPLAKYVPGMYAARVKGRVPDDVEAELDGRGIRYRPRDQVEMD